VTWNRGQTVLNGNTPRPRPEKRHSRVRRETAVVHSGRQTRPGTGSLHPEAIRAAGNETAGASGVEGRLGDLASMQAVTCVNAEQASKTLMQELTRPEFGEGRSGWKSKSEQGLSVLPGY
jgi:hypothetical protein